MVRLFVLFLLAGLSAGCSTFVIPKTYVPDTKVVYLIQNTEFRPLVYPAVAADPYVFVPLSVDSTKPTFLQTSWDKLLVADFQADARLYREVESYLGSLPNQPLFQTLRSQLDSAVIVAPAPVAPETGEKVKDYSNGAVYTFPGAPGAQITVLEGGYYEILYADKSRFRFQSDGSYERTDSSGTVTSASYPKQSQQVVTVGGITYTAAAGYRSLKGPQGTFTALETPEPQYNFSPSSVPGQRVIFFLNPQRQVQAVALQLPNGIRFDYFPSQTTDQPQGVLATLGDQAVFVDNRFEKSHLVFDTKARRTTSVLSLYFPEGIRLTNLGGPGPAYGEVKPAWPEGYRLRAFGPFDVYYTAKDEALVARLKADKMIALEAGDRAQTGLVAKGRRALIIPPDLNSYRKLHSTKVGEVLNWYPSGFETKDTIIMWPISVPRYDAPAGQDYFFAKEFYEILVHEYVHVLVGEASGLSDAVPVWLNEGLAVAVEAAYSPEAKEYWETTFFVSRGLKRLLEWDLVTTKSTGELPVVQARIHYAQSYALVSALLKKYGADKVAQYIRSFRSPASGTAVAPRASYKVRFREVFGVEFDLALKLLDPPPVS